MAFTATEKISIKKILGITLGLLNAQLTSLGADLTAETETDVRNELDRWDDGASTNFVRIHPKEANFGAEIDPGDVKADIKRNIAILLEFASVASSYSNMGTIQIGL